MLRPEIFEPQMLDAVGSSGRGGNQTSQGLGASLNVPQEVGSIGTHNENGSLRTTRDQAEEGIGGASIDAF
jgi:hypothetical protein